MRQLLERQTNFGMDQTAISSNQSGGSNQSEWGYGICSRCEAWDIFIPTKWGVKIRTLWEDGVLYHRRNILYCNQQYDLDVSENWGYVLTFCNIYLRCIICFSKPLEETKFCLKYHVFGHTHIFGAWNQLWHLRIWASDLPFQGLNPSWLKR